MRAILSILMILASLSVIADENVKDHCMNEISSIWKEESNQSVEVTVYRGLFMEESYKFCECMEESFLKKEKFFGISQYYTVPEDRFAQEDICRYQHYTPGAFKISTYIVQKRLQQEIQTRVKNYFDSGVWHLATPESLEKKLVCMEDRLVNKCLRTGSSGVGFHCILHTTTDVSQMSSFEDECPGFVSGFTQKEEKEI